MKILITQSARCISFPSVFGVDTSINQKIISLIPYHLILMLLIVQINFDVSVANDVAINFAKWALSGKVMQGSPCPEVGTFTNENECYIMKLRFCQTPIT